MSLFLFGSWDDSLSLASLDSSLGEGAELPLPELPLVP